MNRRRTLGQEWRGRALMAAGALVVAALPGVWPAAAGSGDIRRAVGSFAGYGGDGGPAADAQLNEPRMVAFDRWGNLYVADTFNQAIRKVDGGTGVISTIAGSPSGYVPRDEADCSSDFGGDGGPATQATLACPHSVAVDSEGAVYVADSANHAIRRVDPVTGTIRTVVGRGGSSGDVDGVGTVTRLEGPKGILFDAAGRLLIADSGNSKIKRYDPATGSVTTIAGTGREGVAGDGGPALDAHLFEPRTLAVATDGSVYVADPKVHRVRRIDPSGIIRAFAGTGAEGFSGDGGPALAAALDHPRGITVDGGGNVFVADSENNRIRRVDPGGTISTVAGTGTRCFVSATSDCGDGGPASEARFAIPRAVAVDTAGNLFIADTFNDRIRRVDDFAVPIRAVPPTNPPTTTSTTKPPPGATSTSTTVPAPSPAPSTATTIAPAPVTLQRSGTAGTSGYWMLARDGGLFAFGRAKRYGDAAGGLVGEGRAVDLEPTATGDGYWIVSSTGAVLAYGDAPALGRVRAADLGRDEQVTSLSATPDGRGYWIFTDRGRVVAFGTALFLGDMRSVALNGPVLDSIPSASGRGYYMVASDGGIFAFGDARFAGSMGGKRLNAPVRSLVPDRDGSGYWLVAADGGIFAFGAPFRGSMGGVPLNRPVTGMVPFGTGYLMVGEDGGIFNFSDQAFSGSLGANPPAEPIVAVAAVD